MKIYQVICERRFDYEIILFQTFSKEVAEEYLNKFKKYVENFQSTKDMFNKYTDSKSWHRNFKDKEFPTNKEFDDFYETVYKKIDLELRCVSDFQIKFNGILSIRESEVLETFDSKQFLKQIIFETIYDRAEEKEFIENNLDKWSK